MASLEGRKRSVAALRELFFTLHKTAKIDVALEIGAKEATYSQRVRELLPEAAVFAFEANPYIFARTKRDQDLESRNIEYLHTAVSDRSGSISFFLQTRRNGKPLKRTVGSNSLMARLGDVETEEISVPSVRVDEFIAERGLAGAMSAWIDVEGAIGLVLEGFGEQLENFLMLFCEVEEREFWDSQWTWPVVQRYLALRGFWPVARDFEFNSQHNVLFLHEKLLAKAEARNVLAHHYSVLAAAAHQPEPSPARDPAIAG